MNGQAGVVANLSALWRIDVVLQATGNHAHAVSSGIINAINRLGRLGKVFHPVAAWGANEPDFDDGLYDYLAHPENEFILFLGFDWHSQSLHSSIKWKYRIKSAPCVKIGYFHETLLNGSSAECQIKQNAVRQCISLLNIVWHASENEAKFLRELTKGQIAVTACGFAVDTEFFKPNILGSERRGFAFFRGKTKPFDHPSQYQERRDLVNFLTDRNLLDVKTYDPSGFDDSQLANEYNDYRVCIDPPSVFNGPTTRVFEGLASGCVVFSHERNFEADAVEELFPLLRTYDSLESLAVELEKGKNDPGYFSYDNSLLYEIRNRISLDLQLSRLFDDWIAALQGLILDAPIVRIFGHPYHLKTGSSRFVMDIFGDCNTVWLCCDDQSRSAEVYATPSYKLGCFQEVAWQTIHNFKHFFDDALINRYFFPMFDGSNHRSDDDFPKNGKYYNFSRRLHDRCETNGLVSSYVKYFPEPVDLVALNPRIQITRNRQKQRTLKGYFWHRTNEISFSSVLKICQQLGCAELIVNTLADPGQNIIDCPSEGEYEGITVTTHAWLTEKKDLVSLLDDCDVYIAPRSCEGIGMSFLEAMARGLCVVGFNAPTMNEYLKNGYNGILYDDIKNPVLQTDFDLADLRLNALRDCAAGFSEWSAVFSRLRDELNPFSYAKQLLFLSNNGVKFVKRFDLMVAIEG